LGDRVININLGLGFYEICGYSYNASLFSGVTNDCILFYYTVHNYEWNYVYSGYSFNEFKSINFVKFIDNFKE